MGKTIEYSNPLVADKAKDKSQMYGPEDSRAWIAYDSGLTRTNFGFRNVIKALGFPSLQDIRDLFLNQTDLQPVLNWRDKEEFFRNSILKALPAVWHSLNT